MKKHINTFTVLLILASMIYPALFSVQGAEVKNKTITKAIARNDIEDVKIHIKNGTDVNAQNSSGWTPLHYASVRGYLPIARLLLDNRARVNIKTKSEKTALHFAADRNFTDLAVFLIERGAKVGTGDNEGWSPLHFAAVKGHTEMVRLLIEKGAEVNMQSKRGGTPLHEASASANAETINLLLLKGADPAIKAANGKTALDYAVELGNKEAENILKKRSNNNKIRVLLTFGGHKFKKLEFFRMFDNLAGVEYKNHDLTENASILKPGLEKDYDVIVMYDMVKKKPFTKAQKKNFIALLKRGIGIVSLHHNLGGHSDWDEYRKILGGKYIRRNEEINGKEYTPSGFAHGQDINVIIADKNHVITKGLKNFTIHDETYGKSWVSPGVQVLLKTDHPKCNPEIAWTHKYAKSSIFFLMLGHDDKAWAHPMYTEILLRGIQWSGQ